MKNNRLNLSVLQLHKTLPDWKLEKIFEQEPPIKEAFLEKPLLILFFDLGCPGCLGRAIPFANRMVYEHNQKLNVLGIHVNFGNNDFSEEDFSRYRKELTIRFPFFKDYNYDTTFLNYGAGGTPHWIVVDKNGIVKYSIFGSDPNNALLRLDYVITELLI